MKKNVILMGFMGSGKTSTGLELSKKTGLPLLDTDRMIEDRAGKTISRIFAEDGEEAFRQMETQLLENLCLEDEVFVISIGGGMPVREKNRLLIKKLGTVIYLMASDEVLVDRLEGDSIRPLLAKGDLKQHIRLLKAEREQIYRSLADFTVDTDHKDPAAAAEEISTLLSL